MNTIIVKLAELKVDETYQRPLKRHHKLIAQDWNPMAAPPLYVCRRQNDGLYVVDGQQRRAAMLSRGIEEWMAIVVDSTGPEDEAKLYRTLNGGNKTVKQLTTRELYKAALTANDPVAIQTKKAIEEAGMKLSNCSKEWPNLTCINQCLNITRRYGAKVLKETCDLLVKVWYGSDYALYDFTIGAVAALLANEDVNKQRLVNVLSKYGALKLYEDTMTSKQSNHTAAYAALVRAYNKGLRVKRLPENLRKKGEGNPEVSA